MKRIAIIGGGASGMTAALFASGTGNRITVFEKQNKTGRKILSTGNGRCNICNKHLDLTHYHGNNPKFVMNVFSKFGLNDTVQFFESLGLPLVEENGGRFYPESGQATSVVDILNYELEFRGVEIKHNRMIDGIKKSKDKFRLFSRGKEEFIFDSVILSTGSCAYPQLGATNAGYELAASFGHTVFDPFPAIVPVNIPLKAIHELQGIKWNCRVIVTVNGKQVAESTDELLFTKYGISGPAALNISRAVNENMLKGFSPQIIIDFFPDLEEEDLADKLNRLWKRNEKLLFFSLSGILKNRMPKILLAVSGIDPETPVKNINDKMKANIIKTFKAFAMMPGKPRSFKESVTAAGGIKVDEIDPGSMESKLVKNLYITGELLDIDGDSGGYNLQFAWSTGAIAGQSQ